MKILCKILFILAFGCASKLLAQSFILNPGKTVSIAGYMEDYETLNINVVNITGDSLHIKWKKITENIPDKWEASVCDNKICYTTLEDSGSMNVIPAKDSGYLLVHFNSHINYGTAKAQYKIWDEKNPLFTDTLTFILTVNPLMKFQTSYADDFRIFPNPSSDQVRISSGKNEGIYVKIYNLSGQLVFEQKAGTELNLSMESWSRGAYVVTVQIGEKIFKRKLIRE